VTVTGINALKVERQVLAKYARERHEDAYTMQAVTNFISTVAAIPNGHE
jgi:hypothetical protein